VGVLVNDPGLPGSGGLISHFVDAVGLVPLPFSVDHGTYISLGREALFLKVPFLLQYLQTILGFLGLLLQASLLLRAGPLLFLGLK
jgi:hypothetical protein